jgi:uncharacterized coiled-coil protein SlyX
MRYLTDWERRLDEEAKAAFQNVGFESLHYAIFKQGAEWGKNNPQQHAELEARVKDLQNALTQAHSTIAFFTTKANRILTDAENLIRACKTATICDYGISVAVHDFERKHPKTKASDA